MLFWGYSLKVIYIKCPQAPSVEEPVLEAVKSLCAAFNKRSHTQPLQTQPNLDFMDYPTIKKDLTEDRHSDFKEQHEKKVKVAGLRSLQH